MQRTPTHRHARTGPRARGRDRRVTALLVGIGVAVVLTCGFGAPDAAATQRPLPASDYAVRPICGPQPPGRASCFAFDLVPKTEEARSRSHPLGLTLAAGTAAGQPAQGAYGLRPQDLHAAYELPLEAPAAQTVGIVDAYDDPTAEADLQVYDEAFGLPPCTSANGCFRKVNEHGQASPLPATDAGWALEISLDVETVRAVCQNCHILLVEAESNHSYDLEQAEDTAVAAGATEVSNSYGGPGTWNGSGYDHPGVVITASTGDAGYGDWMEYEELQGANYPAASPDVVAVGGTFLELSGESWAGEYAWGDGGSGCAAGEAPPWQSSVPDWSEVGCGSRRAAADVSADADPYSGLAVYDSTPNRYFTGWGTLGGTSLSAPIIAAAYALAGGSHGVEYPARTVYANLGSSALHDVAEGSNWGCEGSECTPEESCWGQAICNARVGYDGPTGVGTPDGLGALKPGGAGPSPTVTNVAPAEGPTAGGTTVTIDGTHLGDALSVRFGDTRATVLTDEEGVITAEAPPAEPGEVDVTITSQEGVRSATSPADSYAYVAPPPTVTSVSPASGPTAGGTEVTIEGTHLGEAEYVMFGSRAASITAVEEGEVRVISPPHPAATVDITVVEPHALTSSDSTADRYTYLAPEYLLTVEHEGSGGGTVLVSPGGAACAGSCSALYVAGTTVSLSAAPQVGSTFAGWSGAGCAGTGSCAFTLNGETTVTARFEAVPAAVTAPPSGAAPASASGGSASGPVAGGEGTARERCLTAARRAFRGAVRSAEGTPAARRAAIRRARRREVKRMVACRRHLPREGS